MRRAWRANEHVLRELILYVSQRCATNPKFGSVKLNKILYFSDFLAYAITEKPITGFEYQKLAQGPAPRKLVSVRDRMIRSRELGLQEVVLKSGRTQIRTVNLRSPNLDVFSGPQIAIVDRVIDAFKNHDAAAISELSHLMVGWQSVGPNETIPYASIFLSNRPLTDDEDRRGRELAVEHERKRPA